MRSFALDSNIWRYLVDHDAVEELRRASRANGAVVAILPAVLYETLRMPDGDLRRRLVKAQTRQVWQRPMPEAFSEAEELRLTIERLRPEWIDPRPDLRAWHALRADWLHGTWTRARNETEWMASFLRDGAPHDARELDVAREESRQMRRVAQRMGMSFGALKVNRLESWFEEDVPGWDGNRFETWRSEGLNTWLPVLTGHEPGAFADWLLPWLQPRIIEDDFASWVSFWTREVSAVDLPRHWLRTAMKWAASTRKTSQGTPVDIQISTYLYDCDVFCTSDTVFVDCVEKVRASAPATMAMTQLVRADKDGLLAMLDTMRRVPKMT